MSMSKKDFIALADALKPFAVSDEGAEPELSDAVTGALCSFMRGQNPNFKEGRWRDYLSGKCGPSGGVIKHNASGTGYCDACGHYGEDCTAYKAARKGA